MEDVGFQPPTAGELEFVRYAAYLLFDFERSDAFG